MEIIIPPTQKIYSSRRRFLFRAGMKDDKNIPVEIQRRLQQTIDLGLELADPIIFSEDAQVAEYGIDRGFLPQLLQNSHSVSLFVSTLGRQIDKKIMSLSEQNMVLAAMLLDAWASESLETINMWYDDVLRSKFGDGTRRFSPGYGDMDIKKNYDILQNWLPNNKIVANKKTGILQPQKSTVCLIGWK
jgi:hypothetical protein